MDKTLQWTVDVEYDYGGRTGGDKGILHGLPLILDLFMDNKIKALFFISTELMGGYKRKIRKILNEGHKIGSHGHFHTVYKEGFRKEADRQLSLQLLAEYQSIPEELIRYRAPKFNFKVSGELFSDRKGHTGLLRHMWLHEPIRDIIYLHPFDIVETNEPAPNLFCKLWYSKPIEAYKLLRRILENMSNQRP